MIRQISVFVENQPGSMMNVTNVLTEAHVNIRAISTFDTPEFGIMRLVVDDPVRAKESLTSKGFVNKRRKGKSESDVENTGRRTDQCKLYLFFRNPRRESPGHGISY